MSKSSVGCLALELLKQVKSDCQTQHPTMTTAVMNYDGKVGHPLEPDCVPNPLEGPATYALYQTIA